MRVTKYSHSCIRIDGAGVLVVDPGTFSERESLVGADAVLITHEHPDHVDPDAITHARQASPALEVYAHPDVLAKLDLLDPVTPVEPGQAFTAAGLQVRAYGGRHAVIHPDIPRVANLAYLISDGTTSVYHPGDSFEVPDDVEVDILFVPIAAPWLKLSESIDFVRAVKPRRTFALHDALVTEAGARIADTHLVKLSGSDYRRLAPGTGTD